MISSTMHVCVYVCALVFRQNRAARMVQVNTAKEQLDMSAEGKT